MRGANGILTDIYTKDAARREMVAEDSTDDMICNEEQTCGLHSMYCDYTVRCIAERV